VTDARDTAATLGLAWAPELPALPSRALLASLPMQYARRHLVLPLGPDAGPLTVAVADPLALAPLDDLRFLYERPVEPLVVPAAALRAAIARAYDDAAREAPTAPAALRDELDRPIELAEGGLDAFAERPDLLDTDEEAPVIRLVNALLTDAAKARASDIHIEPYERALVVRFRIDGVLHDVLAPPPRLAAALASRVKIVAGLDVAERRLPQDGRLAVRIGGRDVDVRVSVVPTAFGERVALRLLHRGDATLALEELGMTAALVDRMAALCRRSHGILLVTGPTGSGKTTTLYAALRRVADGSRNVMTIEDPIEYQLPGIAQMQVHPRIGLTFAAGLRAILRQDPDVILVGEIRDRETVEIALQAALTGHLVLATLHTNDAASAVTRLLDMGVEPYLIASSVVAVLAQRLVRRVCASCGAAGCAACRRTGFHGRTGIHELVVLDDALRARIMARADAGTIRRDARAAGTIALRDDGLAKARAGLTTDAEVVRVTQEDD
jgi:general secretion pathway protein E